MKFFYGLRAIIVILGLSVLGCSAQNPRNRFLLAERLWQEGKYQAAVSEYEIVMQKEMGSDLGLQATYRAATTEMLFLGEYGPALRKFTRIIDLRKDSPLAHEANRQIGEILFSKLEQYEQAIAQYQKLFDQYPDDPARAEYLFRIGKSYFFLTQFDQAITTYNLLRKNFPQGEWAERALYEIGISYQTMGNRRQAQGGNANEAFKEATNQFNRFIKDYPSHALVSQAKFEIASCMEEMDQLDAAEQTYESLRVSHPTPQVIELKLKRIRERKAQKRQ